MNTNVPNHMYNSICSGPLIIEKQWRHFKCSSVGEWLNKLMCINKMENKAVTK
jgi:hypothetical protein